MADMAQLRAPLSGYVLFYTASEETAEWGLSLINAVVWILGGPFHLKAPLKVWLPG